MDLVLDETALIPEVRIDPVIEALLDTIMARKQQQTGYVCTRCFQTFWQGKPTRCDGCGMTFPRWEGA